MNECSKRAYFHLSLKYIFYILAHIFLNHVPHMTHDTCYKLNKFCILVQLRYVIISIMIFYSLTVLKIQQWSLRGPVGGPCKSEDITGWGLNSDHMNSTPPVPITRITVVILGMSSANERRRYNVTSSLVGWTQTQHDPWDKRLVS